MQSISIRVINVNDPPVINSRPDTIVVQKGMYLYNITAVDPDHDNLAYELVSAPPNMAITASGTIQWPQNLAPGSIVNVQLRVSDPSGAYDLQNWTIRVIEDCLKPGVSILCSPAQIAPGEDATIVVYASDDASVEQVSLTVDGYTVNLTSENQYVFHADTEKTIVLHAEAVDVNGNSSFTECNLIFSNETDNTLP
jgi:hypothetical protein